MELGAYVYGDFYFEEILMLEGTTQSLVLNISSFGEDEAGEIYVVGLGYTGLREFAMKPNPHAPRTTSRKAAVKS